MIYCISSVFYVRHQGCSLLKTRCLTNVGNEIKSQSFLILIVCFLFPLTLCLAFKKNNLCVPSVLKRVFQMPDYFSSHIHIYSFPIAFVQGKGKGLRLVFSFAYSVTSASHLLTVHTVTQVIDYTSLQLPFGLCFVVLPTVF